MSIWLDDESDNQDEDESHLPDYVEKGFAFIYEEYIPPEEVEAFHTRWGDLERETFVRVLAEGRGQDRLLAMCVLGESELPQTSALLRPFLNSTNAQERWVSALTLGKLKDDVVLPSLIHMLTEFLPTAEAPYREGDDRGEFSQLRIAVAVTLQRWNDPRLISVLRQALMISVQSEAYDPYNKETLFTFQEVLISTLGRWRAFGALTGLVLSPARLQFAIVTLAAGACPPDYDLPKLLPPPWKNNEQFRKAISRILTKQFGLSQEEQNQYLADYGRNKSLRQKEQRLDQFG